MVGEIQSCQSRWLMLEVSFEQRVATVASSRVGHNRTVVSQLLEARVCPSGLNATLVTVLVWPVRGWPKGAGCAGSVRFHNRTVSSSLREARVRPSGLNATLSTSLVWPRRGWPKGAGCAGLVRFHNR